MSSQLSDYEKLLRVCEDFIYELRHAPQGVLPIPSAIADLLEKRIAGVKPADNSQAVAASWIAWFNKTFGKKFQPRPEYVRLVRALQARWFSEEDMRLVALYLRDQWADPKMVKHLVPSSILTAFKFGERLDAAKEWQAANEARPLAPRRKMAVPPTIKDPVPAGEVSGLVATVLGKLKRGE